MFCKKSLAFALAFFMFCTATTFAQGRRGGGNGGGNRGMPASAFPGATVVPPLQRWEYGRLDIVGDAGAKDGVSKITWHGSGAEKYEAASIVELIQKIAAADVLYTTAPTDIDDDLLLWNMLGDKGWEYVAQESAESSAKVRQTMIRFKRPKR